MSQQNLLHLNEWDGELELGPALSRASLYGGAAQRGWAGRALCAETLSDQNLGNAGIGPSVGLLASRHH